jgi:transcriptional regulator with XRE-family HTH domain
VSACAQGSQCGQRTAVHERGRHAMDSFATELEHWKTARNISVRKLASLSGYSSGQISDLLSGRRLPSEDIARDLDQLLKADGSLISAAPPPRTKPRSDRPLLGRSEFLKLAGKVVTLLDLLKGDLPARLASVTAGNARIDSETADGLDSIIRGYRQLYRSAPPSSLLEPVCTAIQLLIDLAPDAGRHREQVISLIGQASGVAATLMMLDVGDFTAARRYMAVGVRAARQAGDNELLSVALSIQAFHACYSGDRAEGLEFSVEAQRVASAAGTHPLTRAWVDAVASEMYATNSDDTGFRESLESSAANLAAPDPGIPWKGNGVFSPAKLTAYQGGGLLRLGQYGSAQAALHAALDQLDPSYLKHRCTAHIDLADAYARDKQPDEAATQGIAALAILADIRHEESMRRAGLLYNNLRRTATPAVRDLRSALMEARAAT